MRVVSTGDPFASLGAGTLGKLVLSSPRGEGMAPGDVYRMSLAAVRHGRETSVGTV